MSEERKRIAKARRQSQIANRDQANGLRGSIKKPIKPCSAVCLPPSHGAWRQGLDPIRIWPFLDDVLQPDVTSSDADRRPALALL
jgi:hypothetical protein